MDERETGQLSPEEVRDTVKRIVARISRIDAAEFDDDVVIREELGIDSLMAMEIIATCERHLAIKIDEAQFADIDTVGDFLDLITTLYGETYG